VLAVSERTAPRHVAIIMDGNRRWAKSRGLPAIEGHRRGILALREVTRAASDAGVEFLTAYGFSTENWQRDKQEISLLFELCVYFAKTEIAELNRNNVRVRIIGGWEELPSGSREALRSLEDGTASNTGLQLNLAVNYSSRFELERAVKAIAGDVVDGRLELDQIDELRIASYFFTAGLPDPELVIRPGGEHRLSNFLLYQAAYSELVMSDTYWPDFGREEFLQALADYAGRRRRFGT
jgi:undecaprenyl diphosphate synthase